MWTDANVADFARLFVRMKPFHMNYIPKKIQRLASLNYSFSKVKNFANLEKRRKLLILLRTVKVESH